MSEGGREGGREEGREGERKGERGRGSEGVREGGREGGRERGREEGEEKEEVHVHVGRARDRLWLLWLQATPTLTCGSFAVLQFSGSPLSLGGGGGRGVCGRVLGEGWGWT